MPGLETKEEWSEWRYRLKDPGKYTKFGRVSKGGGVSLIRGYNSKTGKWETQAIRLSKSKFKTRKEASEWIQSHKDEL